MGGGGGGGGVDRHTLVGEITAYSFIEYMYIQYVVFLLLICQVQCRKVRNNQHQPYVLQQMNK